jgi:spore maturation protein CgeB
MRILIVGETATGRLLGSYRTALESLGHEVRGLSIGQAAEDSQSPWLRLRRVPIVTKIGAAQLVIEGNRILTLEAIAWRPELILTTGDDVLPGTLATIKASASCRAVALYPDTLVNLQMMMIQALPLYDLVAYACGQFGLPYFEALGAKRTTYLPFAWDPSVHPRPADDAVEPDLDVVFAGEWRPDREVWIEALADFKVGVWGTDVWRTKSKPNSVARRSWRGGAVWGPMYAQASRKGRITLNLVDVTNGPGLNMRAFEAVGLGCFVVSTRTAALEEAFAEDEHIVFFDSPTELAEKVTHYLARPAERTRIARNAVQLGDENTYRHRAEQLLAEVSRLPNDDTVPTGAYRRTRVRV